MVFIAALKPEQCSGTISFKSCSCDETPDPTPSDGIVYDGNAVEGSWDEPDTDKLVDSLNEKVEGGIWRRGCWGSCKSCGIRCRISVCRPR